MSITTTNLADDARSASNSRPRAFYKWIEAAIVGAVMAFPLFGTFMPIELYLQPVTFVQLGAQTRTEDYGFSHVVFLGVSVFTFFLIALHFHNMLRAAKSAGLLVILMSLIVVSCAWSVDPNFALHRVLRLFVYAIMGGYLFIRYDVREFAWFMTRVLAVQVFASIAIWIVRPDLVYSSLNTYRDAFRGANIDKNAFGEVMSFGVLCAGYSLFTRANAKLFSSFVLISSLVFVVLSRSTTPRLAIVAIIAMAVFCWICRKRNPGWWIVAMLITVVALGAATIVILNFDEFLKVIGKSPTLTGRTGVWHAVREAISQRPLFGHGYAFWAIESTARDNIWNELQWSPPHAHNGWLDTMLQLGDVGLLVVISIFCVAFARSVRQGLFRKQPDAIFVGFLFMNLFIRSWTETILFEPQEVDLFWLTAAYLYLANMSKLTSFHDSMIKASKVEHYGIANIDAPAIAR